MRVTFKATVGGGVAEYFKSWSETERHKMESSCLLLLWKHLKHLIKKSKKTQLGVNQKVRSTNRWYKGKIQMFCR